MFLIPRDHLEANILYWRKKKIPYRLKENKQRIEVVCKYGSYTNKEAIFPPHEVNFIRQIKQYIHDNKLYEQIENKFTEKGSENLIQYGKFNQRLSRKEIILDAWEVDKKNAYFEMAHRLGLIPEKLYKRGTEVNPKTKRPHISKKTRLAAIGSLAKQDKEIYFNGKKDVLVRKGYAPAEQKTAFLWHTICDMVSRIMLEGMKQAGNDFLFFWVDAMFVRKEHAGKIKRLFTKHGFKYTSTKIKSIHFDRSRLIVTDYPYKYPQKRHIFKMTTKVKGENIFYQLFYNDTKLDERDAQLSDYVAVVNEYRRFYNEKLMVFGPTHCHWVNFCRPFSYVNANDGIGADGIAIDKIDRND